MFSIGQKQRDLVDQTQPRLLGGHGLVSRRARELVTSVVAYPRPGAGENRTGLFISSYGGYGRYLRRRLREHVPPGEAFGRAEVDVSDPFLFLALKRYGIVEQVRGGDVPGYQINPDALRWIAGTVRSVRWTARACWRPGEIPPQVNHYFVECYRRFVDLKACSKRASTRRRSRGRPRGA